MVELFSELAGNPDCRVVVFSGAGKMFTAGREGSSRLMLAVDALFYPVLCPCPGIDLMDMASDVLQPVGEDTARISWNLRKKIAEYQETFSVIERVRPDEELLHSATHPLKV